MTTKHELERMAGYHAHQKYRIDAVREAVRYHGQEMGADAFQIETACQEAVAQFHHDPSSGHRAIEHGKMHIRHAMRKSNVVPMRRVKA